MGYLKDQVRARVASRAELEALQRDVQKLRQRSARLPRLRRRVENLGQRLRNQGASLREQRRMTSSLAGQMATLRTDFDRMANQIAATETRIEWVRERVDPEVFEGTTEERAQARQLIEEIRREHAQIRVRFQVVSNYEERLSRVENALAERC